MAESLASNEQVIAEAVAVTAMYRDEYGWAPDTSLFMGTLTAIVAASNRGECDHELLFSEATASQLEDVGLMTLKVLSERERGE